MRTRLPVIFFFFFVVSSCTTTVSYTGLRPADVSLPPDVHSIVLVNRYTPSKQNRWLNIVESLFTGEILFADRRGVDQALAGLQSQLQTGPKFATYIANDMLTGTGTGMFPPPLQSAEVRDLSNRYKADAVIALEAFDSDIGITTQPRERKRTVDGKEVVEKYFEAHEQVRINIGWRLYTAVAGTVFDQHQQFVTRSFSGTGATADQAWRNLLFPVDAIMQTGREGGINYGLRIAPSWVSYRREIYSKAGRSGGMKQARRMAQRGDWEQAAAVWKKLATRPEAKIARRALFNLAVAEEFAGNIDQAKVYARQAADRYGLRKADQYIYLLNNRLAELQRLDQQMPSPSPEQ